MQLKATEEWVSVAGLRIHCLSAGSAGSPVLLLHGGGIDSSSLCYRPSLGALSEHHRVFAPDWPGYGESDGPAAGHTTEDYVEFLGQLVEALGLERAALVGLSMGGAISLGFTLRSPERVAGLVLVDSYGMGQEVPLGALSYFLVRLPLLNEAVWATLGWSRDRVWHTVRSLVYDPRVITDALVDEVCDLARRPDAGRAWRFYQKHEILMDGARTNFMDRLQEIRVPTLLLHGAADPFVPVSWSRRAQRLIPGAALQVLPACGHWLPREKPVEFSRSVLRFLGEIDGGHQP